MRDDAKSPSRRNEPSKCESHERRGQHSPRGTPARPRPHPASIAHVHRHVAVERATSSRTVAITSPPGVHFGRRRCWSARLPASGQIDGWQRASSRRVLTRRHPDDLAVCLSWPTRLDGDRGSDPYSLCASDSLITTRGGPRHRRALQGPTPTMVPHHVEIGGPASRSTASPPTSAAVRRRGCARGPPQRDFLTIAIDRDPSFFQVSGAPRRTTPLVRFVAREAGTCSAKHTTRRNPDLR